MSRYTDPDFASAALITIDTQRDTLDGQPFEIAGTSAILPQMRALLRAARECRTPIVHIVRIYQPDGSNVDLCRRELVEEGAPLVLAGSPGGELAEALLPDPAARLDVALLLAGGIQPLAAREAAIYKPRWGAFYQTPLEAHLKRLGVSTLIFTGCNFPNCPRTSIYEASERDYRVVLVEDAVSGLYERGRQEMESIGVCLLTAAETASALRAAR
jgi:nicotinamidase-related amidase